MDLLTNLSHSRLPLRKIEVNFNSKLVTKNGAISSDDEDGILTLSKFGSFDDQHELTCKQFNPGANRRRRTELQNAFYSCKWSFAVANSITRQSTGQFS